MPRVRHLVFRAVCAIALCLMAGCSYHFQEANNPLVELGIHKIYVSGFRNISYRPGIEHYFTTAMTREIGSSKSFELVNSDKEADAVLSGIISSVGEAAVGFTGLTVGQRSINLANEYDATVSCKVILRDRRGRQIFTQSVSGDKVHPGAGQIGDTGATASLTNDSEQRLAVQFLATQMMASVYQRMVDTF